MTVGTARSPGGRGGSNKASLTPSEKEKRRASQASGSVT